MPAPIQPIDLIFSAYRRKVLAVLLLRPDEDFLAAYGLRLSVRVDQPGKRHRAQA